MVALMLGIPAWYLHQYMLRRQGVSTCVKNQNDEQPLLVTTAANPHYADSVTDTPALKSL